MRVLLSDFFFTPSETDSKNLSVIDIWTLTSLYWNIDCGSQLFSLLYLESDGTILNAII